MKSKDAINILNVCKDVLELVEKRVREVEDDEFCLYSLPHSTLRGSSDHIGVSISRIRNAVKWQLEAEILKNNNTQNNEIQYL